MTSTRTCDLFALNYARLLLWKDLSESPASAQVIELCMWGFGCHWGDRATGTIELTARSTGDEEGGAKEPARARRARKPWPTVTPWGETGAVHPGERTGLHGGRHDSAGGA